MKLTKRQASAKWRQQLIAEHQPLVEKIAHQVYALLTASGQGGYVSHLHLEDLMQSGQVGLLEAVARYRRDAGPFSHFAYFRVRGAMLDAHKRNAYREQCHESVDAIHARLGFVPAEVQTSTLWRATGHLAPDELAARAEQARLLAEALGELDPDEREVFTLSLAGAPLNVVAARCGRSMAWTRAKLASARAQLGARVISWGIGVKEAA